MAGLKSILKITADFIVYVGTFVIYMEYKREKVWLCLLWHNMAEKKLTVMYSRADYETVNVSCRAIGVYPEPKLFLYVVAENKTRALVAGTRVETTARSGEYDIQLEVLLPDARLDAPTGLCCELRIPETSYSSSKTIVYYPGTMESVSSAVAENGGSRVLPPVVTIVTVTATTLISMYWVYSPKNLVYIVVAMFV